MARLDPHSWYDDAQPRTALVELKLSANFNLRVLHGEATLHLSIPSGGPFDLDTRGLTILGVHNARGMSVPHALLDEDPIVGRLLRLDLPPETRLVTIRYRTSPDATALQWLTPQQTAGKRHPFLFSQCQAIHARSVAPLQDTPAVRVPYRAQVTVPEALTVVMSAGLLSSEPGLDPGTRTFFF